MPKSSPIQTDFSAGEFGPHTDGRVDTEEYKRGLAKCYNYIPAIQGPLVRRPGTKYVNQVKDPSKPPTFIPFKFSDTQQYILEFGDKYLRFHTDGGTIVTTGTTYLVPYGQITHGYRANIQNVDRFLRSSSRTSLSDIKPGESRWTETSVVVGTTLELGTPFSEDEAKSLSYAQEGNSLYVACSTKPIHVLTRYSNTEWDFGSLLENDGPYLPLNTYQYVGDGANVQLKPKWPFNPSSPGEVDFYETEFQLETAPRFLIKDIQPAAANQHDITVDGPVTYYPGQNVYFRGIAGATEINCSDFSTRESFKITTITNSTKFKIDTTGVSVGSYTGSGAVWPAIFTGVSTAKDKGRSVAIIRGSTRYWGYITSHAGVNNDNASARDPYELRNASPANFQMLLDHDSADHVLDALINTSLIEFWYIGLFNSSATVGYPQAVTFHQDRLVHAGAPGYPQKFVGSRIGDHNNFAPSNPNGISVRDTDSIQFNLVSDSKDPIVWAKSGNKGILMGSLSTEFLVSPSSDNQAITPTNVNSEVVGRYGSATVEAVRAGDAIIYVQNSRHKIRELNFFVNMNKHNSILINKLADHIAYPQVNQLAVQNEYYPMVYALRSDGIVAAMTFDRDSQTVRSGWAEFELGGSSDSAGTSPDVKTMGVIAGASGEYDQLWMAVKRFVNGTSQVNIEYMQEPFTPKTKQRDAAYLDAMSTYDSPVVVTDITQSGSAWVTAASHGLSNSDKVLMSDVVGLNSSLVNIDGIVVGSNLVNDKIFIVGSASTNEFFLLANNSSYIDSSTYTPYVSGGKVRKLVSTISGLTHLKGETVDILADGANHGKAVVNSAGVLALTYPAAVVHIGYGYKSRGKLLRPDSGGARGSAIGMTRRVHMVAFNLADVGDFSYGMSFDNMHPMDFSQADVQQADSATPLFTGIVRGGVESPYDFDGQVCFEQSSPLPGMIKSITLLMDEYDV